MARPKKSKDELLSEHINVRYTKPGYKAVLQKATAAGLEVSEYIRKASEGKEITARYRRGSLDAALVQQLISIGNNLNQMTRKFHEGQTPPPAHLSELVDRINEIIDQQMQA